MKFPGVDKVAAFAVLAALSAALFKLPSPAPLVAGERGDAVRARVLETDDSGITVLGAVEFGTQRLEVELPDGRKASAANELRAQLELDKKFAPGDTALVVLPEGADPENTTLVAKDHWRLGWAAALFAAFSLFLCVFGGWTGAKALFSFAFSALVIWKVLVPATLAGCPAALSSFAAVTVLTAVITYLVAGWTRKGVSAFSGAMLGVGASLLLAVLFGWLMHINGATMPFSQQLLYSGVPSLDLADLFTGATVLASSGAVMDLAMDIAAGVAEVKRHNQSLSFSELFMSGVRIGRAVTGTMTTTLLFAYSGGYLTLLMVFAAQGTRPVDFLNSTLVGAEIARTLVGSFGLVLVAPATALSAAFFHRGTRRADNSPAI